MENGPGNSYLSRNWSVSLGLVSLGVLVVDFPLTTKAQRHQEGIGAAPARPPSQGVVGARSGLALPFLVRRQCTWRGQQAAPLRRKAFGHRGERYSQVMGSTGRQSRKKQVKRQRAKVKSRTGADPITGPDGLRVRKVPRRAFLRSVKSGVMAQKNLLAGILSISALPYG